MSTNQNILKLILIDEKYKAPSFKIILSTRFSSNNIHKSNLGEETIITLVCI